MSPDGKLVVVTSESTNMVHIISVPEHEVVDNILVAARPREVTFTKSGKLAYVTCEVGGEVMKLDIEQRKVVGNLRMRREIKRVKPKGILLSHDEKTLYVSTGRGSSIVTLDPATLEIQKVIPVGRRVWGIALSRDGKRLFAANGLDNNISVVDTEKLGEIQKIPTGGRPWGVVLDD